LGGWLSRRLATPFIVDFRDPYVGDIRYDRFPYPPWRQASRIIEARIVRRADAVLTAGESHRAELAERYPNQADRIIHIPNGFTPTHAEPSASISDTIELAVVGTAAHDELKTVATAAAALWPTQLRLHAIGLDPSQVQDLRASVDQLEIVDHGWLPAPEIAAILHRSALLLLVLSERRGAAGGTSTKLYQYLDANRPILALNPTDADHRLLERWATFATLRQPSLATASKALTTLNTTPATAHDTEAFRQQYAWPAIAERLTAILDTKRRTPHE
jgi:glycosyltransferase involved in cell wall biosynthesis